jgi:O-antigen ligase
MKALFKKGGLSTGILNTAILGIVLVTVLFQLYANLMPEAQAAGDDLNESGVPLGSLFVGTGVVFIIVMASLVILVVKAFMPSGK